LHAMRYGTVILFLFMELLSWFTPQF
jgi:hypothetical protein